MTTDLFIEALGTLAGLLYLYWEWHASTKMWVAGVVMPALSLHVYLRAGLYADLCLNLYYLLASLYGWWAWWSKSKASCLTDEGQSSIPITRMPKAAVPLAAGGALVLFLAIGGLLSCCTPSTVPWCDAFTTALSIVGLWMLARAWVEQWWVWWAVDVASMALYAYKGIHFYSALYALYAVVAIFGYYAWKRKMTSAPRP